MLERRGTINESDWAGMLLDTSNDNQGQGHDNRRRSDGEGGISLQQLPIHARSPLSEDSVILNTESEDDDEGDLTVETLA